MYKQSDKYFLPFILIMIFFGCSEEKNPIIPPPVDNLLIETSFEENGQPSSDGWKITSTLTDNFSTDVPDSGGSYSIVLEAGWDGGTAEVQVPALFQYSNYLLSFYSKFNQLEGSATLSLIREGNVVSENSVTIDDTTWSAYSLPANFSIMQGDSLKVTLYGGLSQLIQGQTNFDLCKLVVVE